MKFPCLLYYHGKYDPMFIGPLNDEDDVDLAYLALFRWLDEDFEAYIDLEDVDTDDLSALERSNREKMISLRNTARACSPSRGGR